MEQSSLCPYSTARIDSSSSRDYWVKEHAILLRRRTNHPLFHMTSFTSYKGERQEPLLAPVPANTGCSYDICISKAQDPITCSIFSLEGTHPLLIVYEPSVPPPERTYITFPSFVFTSASCVILHCRRAEPPLIDWISHLHIHSRKS
ncbi:uncharacterized protein PV06_00743 [Exophiala oligosperma]|uniref:Uncharacterized protein n=1 Tax=Exophiala oligosperma TaxID=215243 RepID=A0A0D2EJN5_9EURO|nr:uncharacterized protein PV06_00743 [Exophiala oligosperma]KIW48124.1 hypothetical protein PV06_00743 [Exophiala oligosperma]